MDNVKKARSLAELQAAQRPRYFEGKLLSARDFQDEQDYFLQKTQLHNRLGIGYGVVCGLSVTRTTTSPGPSVHISPGVAIDPIGREIVVTNGVDIAPLRLFDDCDPSRASNAPLPSSVHVSVCYREIPVAEQPVAATVRQAGAEGSEAGRVLESYCLRVEKGAAPKASTSEDSELFDLLSRRRWHDALCLLASADCPLPTDDPCVVLANITIGQDRLLTIDSCGPRSIVPTNRLLMRLLGAINQDRESRPLNLSR